MSALYVDISRVVACPQEVAFDYMTDPRNDPDWWESVLGTTIMSTNAHGVGTRYRQRCRLMGRRFDIDFAVTAHDRPKMFRLETSSGPVRFEAEYRFTAADGGTRVRMLAPVRADGLLFRLTGPVFRWYLLRVNERYFDNLKRILDAKASRQA
ncbi:SRPBCC family protein [Sorangium sp. So ce394]|uniref:SRPBCC family protein n=1 Tax=Sorangium sp. So ce394 TaxID=3133310 RepID=UPI003F5C8457